MRYTNEQRAAILAAGRDAIERAEASINAPRPAAADWPPMEDRVARWKREADEQTARFARERAMPQPLTDWEGAQLAHAIAAQRQSNKKLLAHLVAELRSEHHKEFDVFTKELGVRLGDAMGELFDEALGQVRAETNNKIAKALSNNKSKSRGVVIDLPPTFSLMRKRA